MITPSTISEHTLFSTVRIEVELKAGGFGTGTGFFFRLQVDQEHFLPMIITNKHVITGAKSGKFFIHMAQVKDGKTVPSGEFFGVNFDDFEGGWINHPNSDIDLCAMLFGQLQQQIKSQNINTFIAYFNENLIWGDERLSSLNAIEEVVMIGYPIGLWDKFNNLPIIRRGITASHPAINFQGRSEGVIDIAVFPGSSGSPVLLLNESGVYLDKNKGSVITGSRAVFLGVLYAGPTWTSEGEVVIKEIPTSKQALAQIPVMINLGYMIKAKEVLILAQYIKEMVESHS
jgi:V8-like Glu-specific endopeptidase